MGRQTAWGKEQCNSIVFEAVLTSPIPFPGRDDQPPFPVMKNRSTLPNDSQDSMQPMDHDAKHMDTLFHDIILVFLSDMRGDKCNSDL